MLKVISVLSLIVICCTGQRRWAGSYSRIHPPEDKVTWGDGNYQRPFVPTSTEHSIRYRGKWPADNLKGQDASDVTSSPRNPPIRRDEYDSRMDERPTSETEKFDIDGKRPHDHPSLEDGYHKGEIDRPVSVYGRDYFPRDKGKGEDPRTNRNIPRTVDTRQQTGSNQGNTGKPHGGLPQDRNQKRFPSVSTEAYNNRQRDDLNYKGYEEVPAIQRSKGERTQSPTREYVRPRNQPRTEKPEDDISRGNRSGHKQRARDDVMVGYDRTIGESKHEVPTIEQSHDSRQYAGNNKDDMEKMSESLPRDRNQKRYQPVTTEGYDDKLRDDVSYKGYEKVPTTFRPNVTRPPLTAREYVRPRDRIRKGDRNIHEQNSRDETNDRTILESKQNQGEQYTPAQSKGDTGYSYDGQHGASSAGREYDRRREEELKRREYERRLEEEVRKKGEERGNINIKGRGYSTEHEEEVRERNYEKRQGIESDSINNRRNDQQIKGMVNKREENVKGIEPNRHQEGHSRRDYVTQGTVHSGREEAKGRNFTTKNQENSKGNGDELRTGRNTQEGHRWKGENQNPFVDLKEEDEYRTIKGDDHMRMPDREANGRREIVQNTRKQIKAQHSVERQGSRTERREYSVRAKGDRELDYNPRPPVSRDYNDNIQRTTNIPIDNDDLRLVATTVKRYHTRLDNNRNRVTEQPLIQGVTDRILSPAINSQRKEGSPRNREISQHNTPLNQRRNTDNHQRTTNHRNSEESLGLKSSVTPLYGDANDRYTRRTDTRREESIQRIPNKGENLHNERTVPRNDDFLNPVYSDSGIRQNSPVGQAREISQYPSIVNSRNNARQPTKGSSSWKQSSDDNWKPSTSPLDIQGYHPNVSYDAIVFLDDESDDEGDVWNLSDRKANEPSRTANEDQEDYKSEYRTSARENQGRATQMRINANITLISGAIEARPRSRRAPEEYRVQETRIRSASSQIDESDDVHPDVEILPGYGITRRFGQRNYNDEVIDDEVELFSEKEIKVNARDYKTSGSIAAVIDQTSSNRTLLQGKHHDDLQSKHAENK